MVLSLTIYVYILFIKLIIHHITDEYHYTVTFYMHYKVADN